MLLFSDLHLSPRTFDTCMKVLRKVHQEAVTRQISVGFLGDFFDKVHSQGTLPVNILNELMRYFEKEWTVPMVMIPGNHDYFDAAETEHGLTPFSYASEHIRVLDNPTVINGTLWVPWRRSNTKITQILQEHLDVDAIFGHFDIVGFKMSHTQVSTEGVSASDFPSNIPVYSGHYHTPQTHGNIRYLGSPYQLTLSEAEDKKALVVVSGSSVSELIPIDVGRHQYKWTANELLQRSDSLNARDRVAVIHSDAVSIDLVVSQLQERGVIINVKRTKTPVQTRIMGGERLKPSELSVEFSKRHQIDTSSEAWSLFSTQISQSKQTLGEKNKPDLCPVTMRVQGFGPFTGPIQLSLDSNGFNLVSGEYERSKSASNGAGKSLITAGALLWSLTGMLDGRTSLPFDSGCSVVNEEVGKACVELEGTVNGLTWLVKRTLSKKKHSLQFFVDGESKTRSTLSGTQHVIADELFGLEHGGKELYAWLVRNSVWSQQMVTRWVDANDTAAKAEIRALANIDIWVEMHACAKLQLKTTNTDLQHCTSQRKQNSTLYDREIERHAHNIRMADEWTHQHANAIAKDVEALAQARTSYEKAIQMLGEEPILLSEDELSVSKRSLTDARIVFDRMKQHRKKLNEDLPVSWVDIEWNIQEKWLREQDIPDTEQSSVHKEHCYVAKHSRRAQLDAAKKASDNFKKAGTCTACKRPFEKDGDSHTHARTLQDTLEFKRVAFSSANAMYVDAQQKHIHALEKKEKMGQCQKNIQNVKSLKKLEINIKEAETSFEELQKRVKELEIIFNQKKQQLAIYFRTKDLCNDLQISLNAMQLNYARRLQETCPHDITDTEVRLLKRKGHELETKEKDAHETCSQWSSVVQWSGPRGIQTYALEHTIQILAAKTTQWLQRFFNTQHIQLVASFDEKERLCRHIEYPEHAGVLSGGQWRRAQLAAFMAWREIDNFPLLIMDEACSSMDIDGIHAVQNTLRDWCEEDDRRTCFFISHEPEQHQDTSIYHKHTRILHKRGRSTITDTPDAKRQKK